MSSSTCNLCGSSHHSLLFSWEQRTVVKCTTCGLCFLANIPDKIELEKIYTKDYYASKNSNDTGYTDYKKDASLIALTSIRRNNIITKNITLSDSTKLLDIGCAYGYYLDIARLNGWDVCGIDFSKDAVKEAVDVLKLNVKAGSLAEHQFPSESFDVITCWDLIEHVQDPQSLLKEIHRILKPGGQLVLSTPDIESLPSKLMGQRWMGFKSTEHIYFFSQRTLNQYLAKNNFVIQDSRYEGKYISVELFLNRMENYFGALSKPLNWLKNILPKHFYLNPYDILFIRAQKIN